MNKRNVNLDLIKSLACLGILGLHCIGFANYTVYYLCTYAVPVFFMVNGYLMFGHKEITFKYSLKKILALLRIIVLWNIILIIPVMVVKKNSLIRWNRSQNACFSRDICGISGFSEL